MLLYKNKYRFVEYETHSGNYALKEQHIRHVRNRYKTR